MRIGIGKKIGGVYVGGSVNGKTISKFIVCFFIWPFILGYFMLVWPFVKLYKHNKAKKSATENTTPHTVLVDGESITMSPAEAKGGIERYKTIVDESLHHITETKNPDTFFHRYDMAIEYLLKLSAAYKVCCVDNNAEETLQAVKRDREKLIDDLIDRYAQDCRRKIYELTSEKGKANKALVFKNVLLEYQEKMTPSNIEHVNNKYSELLSLSKQHA